MTHNVTRDGLSNVHSVHVHMRLHHQAVMKIVMLKFVIQVRLNYIKITTTKKRSLVFTVKKVWRRHQNSACSAKIG